MCCGPVCPITVAAFCGGQIAFDFLSQIADPIQPVRSMLRQFSDAVQFVLKSLANHIGILCVQELILDDLIDCVIRQRKKGRTRTDLDWSTFSVISISVSRGRSREKCEPSIRR